MKKRFKFNRIIIIGMVIYVFYAVISRQQMLNAYRKEEQTYLDLIAQEQQRNSELLRAKDNINSTEFIEQIAREKLGMYLPNERVYIDISK
ncbi:MAG: septum formation initiator family protein [Clostridia bacterium]|nr:septum formation initiator family protein [Clostridia bacterium]